MTIRITGAREHNLQHVDAEFGDGLTVVTGVSGSGKTSLVFDTLYHEARRRFLEIFSLGSAGLKLAPAAVDSITGLGPAIAVGQNLLNRNPGSTLATASGLHPFLRLLYARFGERHCAHCGAAINVLSEDEIVERLVALSKRGPVAVFAPLVRGARGSHATLLQSLADQFGAQALRIDGQAGTGRARRNVALDPAQPHAIDVELAHLTKPVTARQMRDLVRQGRSLGASALMAESSAEGTEGALTLSHAPVCATCGAWFGELSPTYFHTPCPHCDGRGCERCDHTGLHPDALAVRLLGLRLPDLLARTVSDARRRFVDAPLPSTAARARVEISRRLDALEEVGLGYITLDRSSPTLSRGEAQRVRLAVALTSRLEDMLHVLDEPTVGQHPADVARLLPAFRKLAGPVVYVEHDRAAAAVADHAIDIGPGAGGQGGRLVYSGTPAGLWQADTPTGRFFSLRERVATPKPRAAPSQFVTVRGADFRTLKSIDVPIPVGRLSVISGVSGSGKSTFVEDVLVASLNARTAVGCAEIDGPWLTPVLVTQEPIGLNPRSNPATYTNLADIIRDCFADATGLSASHFSFNRPEGACPTCNGMGSVEIKMRYLPSTWIPCADCDGQRFKDEVLAARATFGDRELSIAEFYDLRVADAMPLLLETGLLAKHDLRLAGRILEALRDVGLGYLPLGQPSPTLSGGEAQRVKLAKYLGGRSLARHLLVLDEPSTGLHPQDIAGLLVVLDRLVRSGATVVVVEHNTDIIRAADWVIDLGPGAGEAGGELVYAGTPDGLTRVKASATGQALKTEAAIQPAADHAPSGLPSPRPGLQPEGVHEGTRRNTKGSQKAKPASDPSRALVSFVDTRPSGVIAIRGARAHNLQNVSVDFPKGALTVVTGVSGSGKSSLVGDVLEAEARRRFLETLSMYERQSTREGPEAPVESVTGLGVAITIGPERQLYQRRATIGTATEIAHHLAALLALAGERQCLECGAQMTRGQHWQCPSCGATAPIAEPRHFSPNNYAAACLKCHGVGTFQKPNPAKLIIHPERPVCDGAMYSPGFFPKGYLGKPYNHGYDLVQAMAARYGFDPHQTPWNEMSPEAQHAFLYGDPTPMDVTFRSRVREFTRTATFPGFYGWVRDWDTGGTYTDTAPCPECGGSRLRKEYLAVTLGGHNIHALSEMPLKDLAEAAIDLRGLFRTINTRLRFLLQVGLGYVHLNRATSTLSAGEAQRIKLAGLLGSGLTSLTVLLDEPSRGLHPSEVDALLAALRQLRDEGNTVIVVEHDPVIMRGADHLIDVGPGAGAAGGHIVAQGTPDDVQKADTITAKWLREENRAGLVRQAHHDRSDSWLTIRGARGNNLRGETVRLPLGALVGVCGVSGSGKSTLVIDTLGRALAPKKQTTSVAREPIDPGPHDTIEGAPKRVILVDQSRAGVVSPASFLGLDQPLRALYAASEDAQALGLDEKQLARSCSVCHGSGATRTDMGFLPDVFTPCDACNGTGFIPEAWDVRLNGVALPEMFSLTIDEVHQRMGRGLTRMDADMKEDEDKSMRSALTRVRNTLQVARDVGLGYLVLRQPGYTLSGGEAQRLKIAQELGREAREPTLYILDEPTVGQHLEDVARLIGVLRRLVDQGHSVVVVEHHTHLLAACDWLVELGPGGGPEGGRVVAAGTPAELARGETATARYLRSVIGN